MSRSSRRTFLQRSMAAIGGASAFAIAGTKSSGRVLGANDTIRIGVAGLNGRGRSHVDEFSKMPGVQITYLIDPDTRTFGARLPGSQSHADRSSAHRQRAEAVQDIRKALDDQNLDAISIATPNHWHALMTIWACQAGKDVYVEKPCSHNIHEGRIAVETARKHNRIVQHGTQSRSEQRLGERGRVHPLRQARQAAGLARPVLQAARQHRRQAARRTPPSEVGLQPLARAGAPSSRITRQPGPLQLALVLGLRQRRHRQPGRPRDGHGPLGHSRRHAAQERDQPGRPLRLRATRARRPTRRSRSSTTARRS